MTTKSSISANVFASINPSASAGLVFSSSAGPLSFESASLNSSPSASLIPSLFTGPLMPVVQDITKPFYIEKSVIGADHTIALMYTKGTLLISMVLFPSLDNVWQ